MDLVFIEESTPDILEGNLVNFSKLRIVSSWIEFFRRSVPVKNLKTKKGIAYYERHTQLSAC